LNTKLVGITTKSDIN